MDDGKLTKVQGLKKDFEKAGFNIHLEKLANLQDAYGLEGDEDDEDMEEAGTDEEEEYDDSGSDDEMDE